MHVVTLSEPLDLGKAVGVREPGMWIYQDQNAFEIAIRAPKGAVKLTEFKPPPRTGEQFFPTLIMYAGAIGDMLMLTPVLREWKRQTGRRAALCCFRHNFPLLEGNEDIEELVPYPLTPLDELRFHDIRCLENTIEINHSKHPTALWLDFLGLSTATPIDYRPIYHVKPEEKEAVKKHLFNNRPNIALQLRASIPNRDYVMPLWFAVIHGLLHAGWGVLLLGSEGSHPKMPDQLASPFIRDLAGLTTIREAAAVLAQCDAFIGGDSAFLHFAHALDIPAIGLFGPFPWQIRSANAPKTYAISGTGECAGCCWHKHAGRPFPPNKPCSSRGYCTVLASIHPVRIVAKANLLKPPTIVTHAPVTVLNPK